MNPSKWLWLASLALLPFLFAKTGQTQVDSVLFRTAIWSVANFLILALSFKEISFSIFKKIGVLSFLGYASVAILSYLLVHFLYSPYQMEGISEIVRLINSFFSIIFSIHFIKKEENTLSLLAKIISLQAVILAIIGILQTMGVLENCADGVAPCGFLVNRNLFGSYLVLGLPFILLGFHNTIKNKDRIKNNFVNVVFYLTGISIILNGIYLSQTRSAYVATAFIGLVYGLYFLLNLRFLYVALVILFFGSIGGFTFYQYSILNPDNFNQNSKEKSWRDLTKTDSQAERLLMWEKTISMIKENPILGVGFQNWKYQIPKYTLEGLRSEKNEVNAQRPHNDYLWIAAESGIITLLFYLFLMGYLIYIGIKHKSILVLVVFAFLIDSIFSFPKERIVHTLILATSIGIILRDDKKLFHKNSTQKEEVSEIKQEEKIILETPKPTKKQKKKKKNIQNQTQKVPQKPQIILPSIKAIPNYFAYSSLLILGICFYVSFVQNRDKAKTINLLSYNQSRNFKAVLPLADQLNSYFVPSDYFINSIYMHKGYAYLNLQNPKAAKENYLKGLEQMPYSIALLKQVAVLYQNEKKYDSAIFHYDKMQKIIPHLPETYQQIYNNYLLKGDTLNAKKMIEKCPAPCK
ncbi:lipid A core-O-antigen ligase-like enyme [Bernardetia litoralis DSM 6794]|uniref:Lipid A core-O-antigen ligase-like enyme n=1 Tax=Bernardetia litoralis (strain ATCC 23117 / DSM 6794 / NBRC 15988 / NCIMB 1366 / Fx l1 / Sio-4) TaxID=880071 RepID=I4AID1_BERLS|nr:O-antigen ligase family protein [Bernardetia litoralis]AFM03716.1 lipid A core-O-antigen ligase-like enyme [Bernardetia litoralis DSM 6794]